MGNVSCIYYIKNLKNNKFYIGYTTNYCFRKKSHQNALNGNYHKNEHLQAAWNKYGKENFEFEILEEYPNDIQILTSMENWWCNTLNTHNRNYGYNIDPTSPNNIAGLSKETKDKISKSKKGRSFSEEHKLKLSLSKKGKKWSELQRVSRIGLKWTEERKIKASELRKGNKLSDETKKKISIANKGKKRTEEQIKAISERNKGYKHTEESLKLISKASKNRKWLEESKNKISTLKKEWHKNKKLQNTPYTKHNRKNECSI